jgi:hypothetical protein
MSFYPLVSSGAAIYLKASNILYASYYIKIDVIMTNHKCLLLRLNSNLMYTYNMIENLAYMIMGFAATYLSLEVAWHFTACRLKEDISEKKIMKSCIFNENGLDDIIITSSRSRSCIVI